MPQQICGDSALAFQEKVDAGAQTVVGVNKYRVPAEEEMRARGAEAAAAQEDRGAAEAPQALQGGARSGAACAGRSTRSTRAAESKDENVYEKVVEAACADVTHGEICADAAQGLRLRRSR